jgi:cold shock CspA family protein
MASFSMQGTVREFDSLRGRGVIQVDSGECIPVRYSAIIGQGVRILRSGDRVSFELEQTLHGMSATRVARLAY